MIRSRVALAAAACLAGVVSGSLAVAQADTGATGSSGTTATPATITVNGSGAVTIDSSASSATIQASYLTALGSAMTDAKTKATALSAQVGDTLGAVQNITEQSSDGYACSGPMFAAGTAKGAPVPAVSPSTPKKHKSKPKAAVIVRGATLAMPTIARIAATTTSGTCTVQADVTVTYTMAPA
jgi:uncharacterized protein YggE